MKTPRRATLSPKGARAEILVSVLRNVETPGKGAAFPHSRRRSRKPPLGNPVVFWPSLIAAWRVGRALPLLPLPALSPCPLYLPMGFYRQLPKDESGKLFP